jgi:hypothetical protein
VTAQYRCAARLPARPGAPLDPFLSRWPSELGSRSLVWLPSDARLVYEHMFARSSRQPTQRRLPWPS